MREFNRDEFPFIEVPDIAHECATGWETIGAELKRAISRRRTPKPILVVECYPGVDEMSVRQEFQTRLAPKLTIHAADAYHPPERIEKITAPFLSREGAVSGSSARLSLVNFFNGEPLWRFRRIIDELKEGLVLIVGCGASLIAWGNILVYAGLARRAARQRFQRKESGNLGMDNLASPADVKSRRAVFVDWPVADRWKRPLVRRWDYVLDTNDSSEPKLADAEEVRGGFRAAVEGPFRLASPLAPPPGGGRNGEAKNPGPRFDGVLEESSLLLCIGEARLEVPAIDLLFNQPRTLLGEAVYARFGCEFPVRLDYLEGANSSEPLGRGDGWREERLGHRQRADVEMRRHWFSKTVTHDTRGGVNILILVEGDEAVVESPQGAFEPFVVRNAETFFIPAAVGRYDIRPHGPSVGKEMATIKVFVRA